MFRSLASSSSGNLYEVNDGRTRLMLECGLPFHRIQYLLDYNLSSFAACLISHSHADHAQSAQKLIDRGMPVWCSGDTARALGIEAEAERAVPRQQISIGTFRVMPFEAHHDAPCLGYIIYSAVTGEKLLFAVDTEYIPVTVPGLTEIAVEANFDPEILKNSNAPESLKRRILGNHMSIKTFTEMLQANKVGQPGCKVRQIYLLHMSDSRGDAEQFKRRVQEETGVMVEVC